MKRKISVELGQDLTVIDKRKEEGKVIAKGDIVQVLWNELDEGWDILTNAGFEIFIASEVIPSEPEKEALNHNSCLAVQKDTKIIDATTGKEL